MRKHALVLLCLAIVGCDDTPLDPVDSGPTIVTPGTPVTVGAAGAALSTADEAVALTIPAGALASDADVTIANIDPAIPGVAEWSTAVDLGPDGTTFGTPITLSLAVEPEAVPAGVPASALKIHVLGENGWEEVPGSTASADYVVSARIEHFSAYSVQIAPNTATVTGEALTLEVGETASYGFVTFEYRTASGETYPAAHRMVQWESSAPSVLQLSKAEGATDADGRSASPPVEARAVGTGSLSAEVASVSAGVDFVVTQSTDFTGTYILQTVGGKSLPALGTGEMILSGEIVLKDGGSCSFTGKVRRAQEDPSGEVTDFGFPSCEYALDGSDLTLKAGADEGTIAANLADGRITFQILIQDDTDPTDEGVMGDAIFVRE